MAYPSGTGSEIIRRGTIHNQVAAATSFKFDGTNPTTGTATDVVPVNHIITMLSISICDQSTATKIIDLYCDTNSVRIFLLQSQSIGPYETFLWNEKFVLHPGDNLEINGASGANLDIYYTYIDQNWE